MSTLKALMAVVPFTFALLLMLNHMNQSSPINNCKPVGSHLGSLVSIRQSLSAIPFQNKVTAKLQCKQSGNQVQESQVILPLSYCPQNILFHRVSMMEEYIDRRCAPANSADIISRWALWGENSNPIVVRDDHIFEVILRKNGLIEFDLKYNEGISHWIESDASGQTFWVPIKISGLDNDIVVFMRPAAIIALEVMAADPLSPSTIQKAMEQATHGSSQNKGEYYVFEFIGHNLPIRLFQVSSSIESKECSICLEGAEAIQPMIRQPCGHGYHPACIWRWKLSNPKARCPQCRKPLS